MIRLRMLVDYLFTEYCMTYVVVWYDTSFHNLLQIQVKKIATRSRSPRLSRTALPIRNGTNGKASCGYLTLDYDWVHPGTITERFGAEFPILK